MIQSINNYAFRPMMGITRSVNANIDAVKEKQQLLEDLVRELSLKVTMLTQATVHGAPSNSPQRVELPVLARRASDTLSHYGNQLIGAIGALLAIAIYHFITSYTFK